MKNYFHITSLTRKQFLDTMLVLITAELADSLCGIIDGVVVGRYLGSAAMAAHGVVAPIFVILCIFSYMLTVGFQQPCTMAIGRGRMGEARGLYTMVMLITMVLSLTIAIFGTFFPYSLASVLGTKADDGEIYHMAADYLRAVMPGTPALLFFLVLIPIIQIDGQWSLVHIGSAVMGVSDVVFNILNVKYFGWGMWGIGMATTVSYTLGLSVLLIYFFRKNRIFHFSLQDMKGVKIQTIFEMGLPAGLRVFSRALAVVIMNSLVLGVFGAAPMAAFAVQRNLSYLFWSVGVGVSGAVLLYSGVSYGERDREGLQDVIRLGKRNCLGLVSLIGLALFFTAPFIARLYLNVADPAYSLAVIGLRWLALSLPFSAWLRSLGCYLQGIRRNVLATAVFIGAELVFQVLCAFVMGRIWGVRGFFASFLVSQLLVMGIACIVIIVFRDRNFRGLESCLFVPTDFGVPPKDRMRRTVTTPEEVWDMSAQAMQFGKDRGLSDEKAYMVSMYIEEMGNIIMIYGFNDGKPHRLEIRLSIYHGQVIIRFRDDCRRFDITQKSKHWEEDPDHPETSIGVKMVMRACKSLSYNNSLNTNNLMVVL